MSRIDYHNAFYATMLIINVLMLMAMIGCFLPRYDVGDWLAHPGLYETFTKCQQQAEQTTFSNYLSTSGRIPRARAECLHEQCMWQHGYVRKTIR